MGGDNISIILDSPSNSYYAGTNVTGRVIVRVSDKALDIRSLVLKLQGKAHVSWEESESQNTRNREGQNETRSVDVSYSSEEEYFNNKYNLLGETDIPIGENVYPFSSPLPPLLPSSFGGEFGGIKYTVKATIDRPWKFDQKAETEFKVVTPMDLNVNPVAKEPIKREGEKFFCCFCCSSGPLSLILSLPHSGYVPGQPMTLTLEADNASNVEITSVDCKLKKDITWICNNPSRSEKVTTTELLKLSLEGVSPRGSKSWSQQAIIPEMPFTNLDSCSIIKMKHKLVVTAHVEGCHNSFSIEAPIIIGSVPVYSSSPGVAPATFSTQTMNPPVPGYPTTVPSYPATVPSYPATVPSYPATQGFPSGNPIGYGQPSPGYPLDMAGMVSPSAPPEASPPTSATKLLDSTPSFGFKMPTPYP